MKTISGKGVELAFDDVGSGGQTLLLIHGHPFDRTMWRPQLESIARLGWRVVVPDLRGYGASGGASDKLLKGSRLLWLPGVGHMPNLERPELLNAALADFLGRLPSR